MHLRKLTFQLKLQSCPGAVYQMTMNIFVLRYFKS